MTFTPIQTTFEQAVAELRERIGGAALLPGEPGYDDAVAAWNVAVHHRPAVAVVAATPADVAEAARLARRFGLPVVVQATGHGASRPADGAVLVVTRELTGVSVDPAQRVARVEAGTKWGAVLSEAQAHGLAPLLGSSPEVGAVGYTLGGGMGWLARRYGLAADSVRSFDLVTPDGIEVRVSATEQPELFWALRGAGSGSLGIVTAMEVELYPVSTVYAGNLLYPAEAAHEVLARWRTWIEAVPEELTSAVCLMNFPPLEAVPEPLRGRSFTIVRGCYAGDLDAGKALVDQWRAWREPLMDLWAPMPFSEIAHVSNDPVDPMPITLTSEWFDALPDGAIDVIIDHTFAVDGPPPVIFAEFRHGGGAIARNAGGAANDRGRRGLVNVHVLALNPPGAAAAVDAHLQHLRAGLAPYATGATYLNFVDGPDRDERVATAFSGEHLARWQAVKATLDPEGRFTTGVSLTAS